jgi:hypothetical protein
MTKDIRVLILSFSRGSLLQVAAKSIDPTEPKGVTLINKLLRPLTQVAFSLALAASAVLFAGAQASAQCPATPLTSGLQIPLGISQSNQGNLLVSESGTFVPNTGRISVVGLNGTRRTLLDGLPSGLNDVNEPAGPAGLFMSGRTLYVAIGIGDSFLPGTFVPNPNPSSPLFSSVLAIHFSADVEKTTEGFTLSPDDQEALAHGQKATLSNDGRDHITVELVADFPNLIPDPTFPTGFRGSNPFDLVAVGDRLYVTDGGQNLIWRADIPTGAFSTLAAFPNIPNPLPFGPPVLEAVPTGIRYSNGQLFVTLFRGFPFPPGASVVKQVNPLTGTQTEFIAGLSSAIDVLPVEGKGNTDYLVLELSNNFLAGQPGRLLRFNESGVAQDVIADCLITPTAMTLDEKTKTLYVTELATGRVVAIPMS